VKPALVNADLSWRVMQASPQDLAQVRLDNALALFEEFVRATARHADAATLRGLEKRFAEKIQIQPSYWSQIKGRSRQIGERLARQFEQLCHKPAGWMDVRHPGGAVAAAASAAGLALTLPAVAVPGAPAVPGAAAAAAPSTSESTPRDDDERFIVGLVLTYYRRHPQRARARLLDLLGEVLTPGPVAAAPAPEPAPVARPAPGVTRRPAAPPPPAEDPRDLWLRTQTGVAPLKKKP
jgi:hypothetical protein